VRLSGRGQRLLTPHRPLPGTQAHNARSRDIRNFPPPPAFLAQIRGRHWSTKVDNISLEPPESGEGGLQLNSYSIYFIRSLFTLRSYPTILAIYCHVLASTKIITYIRLYSLCHDRAKLFRFFSNKIFRLSIFEPARVKTDP
jgi:hypothetical protein